MKRKLLPVLAIVLAVAAGLVGKVLATPPSGGFTGTTLASATFDQMKISGHGTKLDRWRLLLLTHRQSDLYVQSNSWPVGGSTGWHTHSGPSLIILKRGGILTDWEYVDGVCSEHVYDATNGDVGFIDAGGKDHAHVLVNNGPNDASTYAVQFVPQGAPRRIDVTPAPPNCGPPSS